MARSVIAPYQSVTTSATTPGGASRPGEPHNLLLYACCYGLVKQQAYDNKSCCCTLAVTARRDASPYRTMMYVPAGLLLLSARRPFCTVNVKFAE